MRIIDPAAPLEQAIGLVGSISAMARALQLSSPTVIQQWRRNRVPAGRCPDIEALTGVACEALRPDVNWSVLRNTSTMPLTPTHTTPAAAAAQGA